MKGLFCLLKNVGRGLPLFGFFKHTFAYYYITWLWGAPLTCWLKFHRKHFKFHQHKREKSHCLSTFCIWQRRDWLIQKIAIVDQRFKSIAGLWRCPLHTVSFLPLQSLLMSLICLWLKSRHFFVMQGCLDQAFYPHRRLFLHHPISDIIAF